MKIYLAAVEHSDCKEAVEAGVVENGFASYFYTKERSFYQRFLICTNHVKRIVMDSGAHSFFSSSDTIASAHHKKSNLKQHDPKSYFASYLEWLKGNHHHLDYFVELDIGEIVGQRKVEHWREKLAAAGLLEKCIIVYHPEAQTFKRFVAQMQEHPSRYVAIEGFRSGRNTIDYLTVIKACYDAGVKVHGFAMTKPVVLETLPFYSVDSASWKAGGMYGSPFLINPQNQLKSVKLNRPTSEKARSKVAATLINNSFPISLMQQLKLASGQVSSETRAEVLKRSAEAVKKAEEFYTRYWIERGVDWEKQIRAKQPPKPKPKSRSSSQNF